MKTEIAEIPVGRLLIDHLYVGILITLFYVLAGPIFIGMGWPGIAVLLLAEIVILLPAVTGHFLWPSFRGTQKFSFKALIPFQQGVSKRSFAAWVAGGLVASLVVYIPLYPAGLYLRESVFHWLPEWYFNPGFGAASIQVVANTFLLGIFVDGLIGPIAEELFFRGYLLPRMTYLKKWAPVVNGSLFGLYHFWQPHNLPALIGLGIVFSYAVWKTRNVYVGIAIHCTLNMVGALGGYLAAMNGTIIGR
jgi:membrane protease YdiL (CAAX protease family)